MARQEWSDRNPRWVFFIALILLLAYLVDSIIDLTFRVLSVIPASTNHFIMAILAFPLTLSIAYLLGYVVQLESYCYIKTCIYNEIAAIKKAIKVELGKGSDSEDITQAELKKISKNKNIGANYLYDDGTIVLLPDSENAKTQEIDHLFITTFGVFLLETKHYGQFNIVDDRLIFTDSGQYGENPLVQSAGKVRKIQGLLGKNVPVHGLAVFTRPDCILGHSFPPEMIKINDLKYKLLEYQDKFIQEGLSTLSIKEMKDKLKEKLETGDGAKHAHLLSIGAERYLTLLKELGYQERVLQDLRIVPPYKYPHPVRAILFVLLIGGAATMQQLGLSKPSPAPVSTPIKAKITKPEKGKVLEAEKPPSKPVVQNLWIPPAITPYPSGYPNQQQMRQAQENATAIKALYDKGVQCFYKKQYQCAYERSSAVLALDPYNGVASGLQDNAIREQNNLLKARGYVSPPQDIPITPRTNNLPGYTSQP